MKSTTIILTEGELRDFIFQNFSKNKIFKEHKSYIQFDNVKKKIKLNEAPDPPIPTYNFNINKTFDKSDYYDNQSPTAQINADAEQKLNQFLVNNNGWENTSATAMNTGKWYDKLTKIRGTSNRTNVKLGTNTNSLSREEKTTTLVSTLYNQQSSWGWDVNATCFDWVMDGASAEAFGAVSGKDFLNDDLISSLENTGFKLQEIFDAISMVNLTVQIIGHFMKREIPFIGQIDNAVSFMNAINRLNYIFFLNGQIENIEKQLKQTGTYEQVVGTSTADGVAKDLVYELDDQDVSILREHQTLNYIFFILDLLAAIPFIGFVSDAIKNNLKFERLTGFFAGKSLGEKSINLIRYVDPATGKIIQKTVYKLTTDDVLKVYKHWAEQYKLKKTTKNFTEWAKNLPNGSPARDILDAATKNIPIDKLNNNLQKLFKLGGKIDETSDEFMALQQGINEVAHQQGWLDWFKNRRQYKEAAANAMKDVLVSNTQAAVKTQLILSLGEDALKLPNLADLGQKEFYEIIATVVPEFKATNIQKGEEFIKKVVPIINSDINVIQEITHFNALTTVDQKADYLNNVRKALIDQFEKSNQLASAEEFFGLTTKNGGDNRSLTDFIMGRGPKNVVEKGPNIKYYDNTDLGRAQHKLDKFLFDNADNLQNKNYNIKTLVSKAGLIQAEVDAIAVNKNLLQDYGDIIKIVNEPAETDIVYSAMNAIKGQPNVSPSHAGDVQNFIFAKIRGNYINKIRKLTTVASDLDAVGNPKINRQFVDVLKTGLSNIDGSENAQQALQFFAKISNGAIDIAEISKTATKAEDLFKVILKSLNHQCAIAEYVISPGSMKAEKAAEIFTNSKIISNISSGGQGTFKTSGGKIFNDTKNAKNLNFGRAKSILGVFRDASDPTIVEIPKFIEKIMSDISDIKDYATFTQVYKMAQPQFTTLIDIVNRSTGQLQAANKLMSSVNTAALASSMANPQLQQITTGVAGITKSVNTLLNTAMETLNASSAGDDVFNVLQDLHTFTVSSGDVNKINPLSGVKNQDSASDLLRLIISPEGQRVATTVNNIDNFKNMFRQYRRINARQLWDLFSETIMTLVRKAGRAAFDDIPIIRNYLNGGQDFAKNLEDIEHLTDIPLEDILKNDSIASVKSGWKKFESIIDNVLSSNLFATAKAGYEVEFKIFEKLKYLTATLGLLFDIVASPIRMLLNHTHLFFVVYNIIKYSSIVAVTVKMGFAVAVLGGLTSILHGLFQGATFKLLVAVLTNAKKVGFKSIIINSLASSGQLLLKTYKMYKKWKEKSQEELARTGPILELEDIAKMKDGPIDSIFNWFIDNQDDSKNFYNNMLLKFQNDEKTWNIDPNESLDLQSANERAATFAKNVYSYKGGKQENGKKEDFALTFSQYQSSFASRIQDQFDSFINTFTQIAENKTEARQNFDAKQQQLKIQEIIDTANSDSAFLNGLKFEYLTTAAFKELRKAFQSFDKNLSIANQENLGQQKVEIFKRQKTILFYFYIQQCYREQNFSLMNLYRTYIIALKNQDSNKLQTAPMNQIDAFIQSVGLDVGELTAYDKLIFTTFIWNMIKNKTFLMSIRKDASMENKRGYLNLDAMLCSGLYGIKFKKEGDKIILINANYEERYASVYKDVKFKSTYGEFTRKSWVPYLRDVAGNPDSDNSNSKLFKEIFLSQFQNQNKNKNIYSISWDPFDIILETYKTATDLLITFGMKIKNSYESGSIDFTDDWGNIFKEVQTGELVNESIFKNKHKYQVLKSNNLKKKRKLNELRDDFIEYKQLTADELFNARARKSDKHTYDILHALQQNSESLNNTIYTDDANLSQEDANNLLNEKMANLYSSLSNDSEFNGYINDIKKYRNYKVKELYEPGVIIGLIDGFKTKVAEMKPALEKFFKYLDIFPSFTRNKMLKDMPVNYEDNLKNFMSFLDTASEKMTDNFAEQAEKRIQLLNPKKHSEEQMHAAGIDDEIISAVKEINQGGVYNPHYRPVMSDQMKTIKKLALTPEKVSLKNKLNILSDKSNELLYVLQQKQRQNPEYDSAVENKVQSQFNYALVDYLNVVINSVVKEINSDSNILINQLSENNFSFGYPNSPMIRYNSQGDSLGGAATASRHYFFTTQTAVSDNARQTASQNLKSYYNEIYNRLLKSEYTQSNEKLDQAKLKDIFEDYHQFVQSMFDQNQDYSSDKILSKDDKIIGFYEDEDAFKKWAEKFKQKNNIEDPFDPSYDLFKNMTTVFEDGIIINKLIFISNYGLNDLATNTNNQNFKKLYYLYEVDITYLYENVLKGQKKASIDGSEIRTIEHFVGFPLLCKDCFTVEQQESKLNIISPETQQEEIFDFSFYYFKPADYTFKHFKRAKSSYNVSNGKYSIKTLNTITIKDFLNQDK